jgi:hypothetical protein
MSFTSWKMRNKQLTEVMSCLDVSVVEITVYTKNKAAIIEMRAREWYPMLKNMAVKRAARDIEP